VGTLLAGALPAGIDLGFFPAATFFGGIDTSLSAGSLAVENRLHCMVRFAGLGQVSRLVFNPAHAPLALRALPARAADDRHRFTELAERPIRVAFLLSEGARLIDFAGPWEVFQDAPPAPPLPSPGKAAQVPRAAD
jgi:hypothetical protein